MKITVGEPIDISQDRQGAGKTWLDVDKVYLNDELVTDVVELDTDESWLTRYTMKLNQDKKNPALERETLYGKVTVKWKENK